MKTRSGFVSNSSSSSFIIADIMRKGLTKDLLPEAIHTYEGYEGKLYTKDEVLADIRDTFKKIEKDEVIKIIDDYEKDRELSCDSYFRKNLEHDFCDYYIGGYCDEGGGSDFEHRIMPYIADVVMSHH